MPVLAGIHTAVLELIWRLRRDTSASVAPMAALVLIPILSAAGAAVDYSRANNFRTAMQTALDAGLIAGAKDGTTSWAQVASSVFSANLKARGGTADTPSFTKDSDVVFKGTVTGSMPTSILGIIKISAIPVKATAMATASDADDSCILTLDQGQPASHVGLLFNGAPVINLSGCSIRTNTSLDCNGHDTQAMKSIAAGSATDCSKPKSNAPLVPDIYKDLASNITTKCGTSRPGVSWTPGMAPSGTGVVKVSDKEYHICGDLNLSGTGSFAPTADTLIVIENGSLNLANNADASISKTTVVMTGNNSYPSAINFPQGNGKAASLTLSPSVDPANPWHGVALFQDPKLTNTDNKWGPGADFNADGLVYLPNSNIVTDGNTSSSNSKCSKFVMNSFTTNGKVSLDFDQSVANCAAIGLKQWGGITVRLIK
jgi:putative Flp pilus-assembly TadE/G-like protein